VLLANQQSSVISVPHITFCIPQSAIPQITNTLTRVFSLLKFVYYRQEEEEDIGWSEV